jgi:MtN3 and saliva related transmembrane protein
MLSLETLIGFAAAVGTTFSHLPQVLKCWKTGATGDLSLKMFLMLFSGISLWVVYGFMKGDMVIIAANAVSLLFVSNILFFKIRELRRNRAGSRPSHSAASQAGAG